MARLAGIDLPKNKRVVIALTYIYGVGLTRSQQVLDEAKISYDKVVKDLEESDVIKLRDILNAFTLEGDLRREVSLNIKRLQEINCYVGSRHRKSLPCRGQRTKTNARTKKGRKRTVANKKMVKK